VDNLERLSVRVDALEIGIQVIKVDGLEFLGNHGRAVIGWLPGSAEKHNGGDDGSGNYDN